MQIAMEVRNRDHADRIVAAVRAAGYLVSEPTPR